MSLNISRLRPVPDRLAPGLLLNKPQTTDAPKRIVDLSLRVQPRKFHKWLGDRAGLFVGLGGIAAMVGAVATLADVFSGWAAVSMLLAGIPGLTLGVPLLVVGFIGEGEEDRQVTEAVWLDNAAEASLADWLTARYGQWVSRYSIKAVTGDVATFVNEGAVGRIRFETEAARYEVWRTTSGGALTTNLPVDVQVAVITPRGTTKKVAAAGDPAELFDGRGRGLLGQAQTLLTMLADVTDVEAAHRVARAGEVVTQTLALAGRAARYGNLQRRRTMQGINRALADAVADLEDVRAGQEIAVERDALVLARFTGQVMAVGVGSQKTFDQINLSEKDKIN